MSHGSSIHPKSDPISLGDTEVFSAVFREYFPSLVILARTLLPTAEDAEDLVQDCFTRLWTKRSRLDDREKIRQFLMVTVRNASLSRLRKRKSALHVIPLIHEIPVDDLPEVHAAIVRAEMLSLLENSLQTLPARIRQVCELYYLHGLNEQQIGGKLNTSRFTVRFQRQRGIMLLRSRLKFP